MSSYDAVRRLASERPDWVPIMAACHREATRPGTSRFAGRWVLNDLRRRGWRGLTYKGEQVQSFPGLKMLERYGILEHDHTTRAGRRAYYTMRDPEGVDKALQELGSGP